MAVRAAEFFADHDVVAVGSSPLERARETVQPIADSHGLVPGVDDRLIEASNVFEGLTFGVGDGSLLRVRHWKHLRNPFRPSWGEPYAELAQRMRAAMDDAAERAEGHEVVLVSHQLPIWIARSAVEGRRFWHDPRRRQCSLASVTSFIYSSDGEIVLVSYAEPAADLLPAGGKPSVAGA
jgi:broad specificity phosphatase PhoE